jgi:hypothetical protein
LHRLAEAIGPDYAAMVYLGAVLGLRVGECMALRVGRVDILHGTLAVAESVSEVHGTLAYGEPKSEAGRRTMTMPAIRAVGLTGSDSTTSATRPPRPWSQVGWMCGPLRRAWATPIRG